MIHYVSIQEARRAEAAHLPWAIRLEYVGRNGANVSGKSSKFWMAVGTGTGDAEVNFGKLGSDGRATALRYGALDTLMKAAQKISEGYKLVTPGHVKPAPTAKAPVKNGILDLPEPFCRIALLLIGPNGKISAVDKDRNLITYLTDQGAEDLNKLWPDLKYGVTL